MVIVPFPYADKLAEKRRPALIVSGDRFNARTGLVWVAMITSAVNRRWDDDVDLGGGNTGLNVPSLIRLSKIVTIEPARIVRIAGKVSDATKRKVKLKLLGNLR